MISHVNDLFLKAGTQTQRLCLNKGVGLTVERRNSLLDCNQGFLHRKGAWSYTSLCTLKLKKHRELYICMHFSSMIVTVCIAHLWNNKIILSLLSVSKHNNPRALLFHVILFYFLQILTILYLILWRESWYEQHLQSGTLCKSTGPGQHVYGWIPRHKATALSKDAFTERMSLQC